MKSIIKISVSFLILILSACASSKKAELVEKDYDYMATNDYQKQQTLTHGLFGPNDTLTESAIQKILTSKVVLPKKIRIAIIRLAESYTGFNFEPINNEINEQFYSKLNWGERVQSIIPVPQVMVANPITLTSLRNAAVLLQADVLVIIKPASSVDVKHQWLENNKAKGVSSLEVLLLDTRTSVVPYTTLITETAEVSRESTDFNDYQYVKRAKKESELKALLKIPNSVQKFIIKTM